MLFIKLREDDKATLKAKFTSTSTDGGIRYKEALSILTVNTLKDKPFEEPWVLRSESDDQKTSMTIKDFLESKLDTTSSYQSTKFSSKVSTAS
jgi:hypothetical protein